MIPHDTHLQIGSLLFEGVDQIDLTGPFEVLSRIPNSTHRIYSKSCEPVRDLRGLQLTADAALADAPQLDVLHVPGGFGQEALMEDKDVLGWIAEQAAGAHSVFSVCTGALLCGAAGLLRGTPGDNTLGVFSSAAIVRRHPSQRTRRRGWQLGVCRGRHRWNRRRPASCGRVARQRRRQGDPALHGVRAGTSVQ
jgi:transcriptional regulator GlxA family with amidase domain